MSEHKVYFILILILLLALGGAVYTQGFSNIPFLHSEKASQQDLETAKEKAREFILSNNLVQDPTDLKITTIEEEGSLYKVALTVGRQSFTSYMKKDFSIFFPTALDMNQVETEENQQETEEVTQEIPKSETPEVQLFTMSYCPYGNQAENIMKPVVDLLGNSVTVEPHYIFYDNYQRGGPEYCIDEESKYCSMHGVEEANQNLRELCVFENQKDMYWDFVDNANQMCTVDDIETCWQDAAQETGVNVSSVEACFNQNYLSYAEAEQQLTDDLGVQGSPTLIINGVTYQGNRSAEGYKNAICSAFNNPPEACSETLSDTSAASGGC
ncbi:MAG: thioredoxin domain-containing protein [Patescibacteria group bacterium]|nr:thioredoxin domain-containing protein [Patescibacteria group bacterium]